MKKILIMMTMFLLSLTLSSCVNNDKITFELSGEAIQNYTVGDPYLEQGYIARLGSTSIYDDVVVNSNVDATKAGDYEITYTVTANDIQQELKRTVYYREEGCFVVEDTNTTRCDLNFTKYLNTYIKLTIYYDDPSMNGNMTEVFDNVESIIKDYHELSNKYDAFEGVVNVKTINDNPTQTHILDEKLFDLIKFTIDHQSEVDNLFNLALGPVLSIWHDYRENCNTILNCAVPNLSDLQDANQYTNYENIVLDEENLTITMEENMSIDLGGVSKGYISEIITDYLDSLALTGYLLNNGQSNISAGGTHPLRDHGKFILGVSDPERNSSYDYPGFITVMLGDGVQLVTSGDNQQYYTVGEDIYHHIINPNTLMPERYSRTVSIIVNGDAGLADLYSTAIFTMSMEDGLAFVNSTDGLEAVWYEMDGTITYSENFKDLYLGTEYKTE